MVSGEHEPKQRRAHLVFTRTQTVLDAREKLAWNQLQSEYPDYMTSLGPWSLDELAGFFAEDDGPAQENWPWTYAEMAAFFASAETFLRRSVGENGRGAADTSQV